MTRTRRTLPRIPYSSRLSNSWNYLSRLLKESQQNEEVKMPMRKTSAVSSKFLESCRYSFTHLVFHLYFCQSLPALQRGLCATWSPDLLGNIVTDVFCSFLANVNSSSGSLYVVVRPSVVCRLSSVVCRLSVCRL